MTLKNEEIQKIGEEEKSRWQQTHKSICDEIRQSASDLREDKKLARELTSEIVAATRDEDKIALASDEAVAHGLVHLRKNKSKELERLLEQPYFARVITQEEKGEIEFCLGTASFPKKRIIDWRQAPISRLYYDYEEGEDFAETIQGREREGIIKLRRSYQGKEDKLNVIDTADGSYYWFDNKWNFEEKASPLSRTTGHDGHLPPILSLITPEQFKLITRDPQKNMIIQGIAGSGKTTVALHRLAWLLHEDNSDIKPEKSLVVMLNQSLKAYVETTLPELNISHVPIRTYTQWANAILQDIMGMRPRGKFERSIDIEQFKSSAYCLQHLKQYTALFPPFTEGLQNPIDDLFNFFKCLYDQKLSWPKENQIKERLLLQTKNKICDLLDDSLLLHLIFERHGRYPTKSPQALGLCDHIVVDEVQDFGVVEVGALLNALNTDRSVTLVGDSSQKIVMGRHFSNWEEFLRDIGLKETTPLELTVSYRTTEEIMEVACCIREKNLVKSSFGASRHGLTPTFIQAENPQVLPNMIGQWITARLKESAHTLCAVICRWPNQAQHLVHVLRKMGYASVRWGYRDQFDFSPGVTVTNVHQVKGLEFRNVLVVEPSNENYKTYSEEDKNLLYVAVTRAESRLDFIGAHKPTDLLPELPVEMDAMV